MDWVILYFSLVGISGFFEGWCRAIEGGYMFEDMLLATAANLFLTPLAIFLNVATITKHYFRKE